MPASDGYTYGFGNSTSPRFRDPPIGRLERMRARFAAFGGPVPEYLASLSRDEEIHCAPIDWLELDQWHRGRVILIGDAAHASIPMLGQGGCLAMEDAYVLAEVLRETDSVEHAFEAYVSRRKPRVVWVQQESHAAAQGTNLPLAVRNAALRERGDPMLQHRFMPLKSEV
jgi:FAD-dependent urate hydroxylase